MTTAANLRRLDVLGWSTTQGDAAVAGDLAAETEVPLSACPWPNASTLAHPWRAGWIARMSAIAAPPNYEARRSAGAIDVIIEGNRAATRLALTIDRST